MAKLDKDRLVPNSTIRTWLPTCWQHMGNTFIAIFQSPVELGTYHGAVEDRQEAQLQQRDSVSATHVFLGPLTDRARR